MLCRGARVLPHEPESGRSQPFINFGVMPRSQSAHQSNASGVPWRWHRSTRPAPGAGRRQALRARRKVRFFWFCSD